MGKRHPSLSKLPAGTVADKVQMVGGYLQDAGTSNFANKNEVQRSKVTCSKSHS